MKKNTVIRSILIMFMCALMVFLCYVILESTLPELFSLLKTGDLARIQRYLKHQETVEGLICVGLIQILQIWTIVISATPMQIAAGVVFGVIPSFLVCSAASVIGLTLSFLMWKYLGHILEKIMPLSEKEEDMIHHALKRDTPPEYLLFLVCFLFVMPNGLIPILASKTAVSLKKYVAAITPGISFNVLICTLAGDRLLDGDWFALLGVILLSAGIIGFFWKHQDTILRKISKS